MNTIKIGLAVMAGSLLFAPGAFAQTPPALPGLVLRDDLAKLANDVANMPNQETIMQVLELPPGGVVPWHTHPDGHEISYLIEGSATLEIEGQPVRTLKAGDGFHINPGVPHSAKVVGADKAKVLVVRITEKGKPIAVPWPKTN
jgi:quercetin dioxygenase-like cupin family protein